MIHTIIIDFGKVLGNDANEWGRVYKKILEVTGLNEEEINKIWSKSWMDIKLGKKDDSVFWKEVVTNSKRQVSINTLKKIYDETVSLNHDVFEQVKKIKEKGFNIVILANASRREMRAKINKIKKLSYDKLFTKIYYSADLGMAKPDKKIFKYVLKNLNLSPKDVIFIDDKQRNLDAAEKLGIKGIIFKDVQKLKKDLSFLLTPKKAKYINLILNKYISWSYGLG